MDTDKAYLLGLIIGGGVFGNAEDVFRIRLPYKEWGSYIDNPERAGKIAGDILSKVGQMFRAIYGLSVQYETSPGGTWTILCEGDTSLVKDDLTRYGISCEGEIKRNVDIEKIVQELVDDNLKRRFVAGIADTIGSMAKSQRRFSQEHQIISFEINGYNFKFVCQLCQLLNSINCTPDQVNWNHPNIHCASDPYYKQWHKGFKLRILLDQYAKFGAFAFRTKAESSSENRKLQHATHKAIKCEERELHIYPSTIHTAENDPRLPDIIRGGHYIHFKHICAVLGCEHAPYSQLDTFMTQLGHYITPFPILYKDEYSKILSVVNSDSLLFERKYQISNISVSSLFEKYQHNNVLLLFGHSDDTGYPISELLKSIAYIIADKNELYGKRPKGGYIHIIEKHISENPNLHVEMRKPDLLTPLIILGNGRGALIGAKNPSVYEKLLTIDPNNKYKVLTRKITEKDLK